MENKLQKAAKIWPSLSLTVREGKIEIVYRIKEDADLVRAAKYARKNAYVQKNINHLKDELAKGNNNSGIGQKSISKSIIEHRGKNGGRLYVRELDGVTEIVRKSGKNKSNQQFVINRLKEIKKDEWIDVTQILHTSIDQGQCLMDDQ